MKYSIDTSAILDGWRRYYSPDVFPALWNKLEQLIESGDLRATEEVLVELKKKDDDVHRWARENGTLFVPIDEETQRVLSGLLERFPRLVNTQRARSTADPWVIALAQVKRCTVITGESPSNNPNRPKVPDACRAIGIRCINLLHLARDQGWVF